MFSERRLLAVTLGDVAGIGPEVLVRAWSEPEFLRWARPFVVGQREVLERAVALVGARAHVVTIDDPGQAEPADKVIPCLEATEVDLGEVAPGRVDSHAGRAAYDFLNTAIDLALAGRVDAIVTLPVNKEALHAAGVAQPGHTEILAERCRVSESAMMLYVGPPVAKGVSGLGVLHTTYHVSLRRALDALDADLIERTIALADLGMSPLTGRRRPRIAVAGLNPHAGEHGLFGDEETWSVEPAIARAIAAGYDLFGPVSPDTVFRRALEGEFDAVVALYHDQGHVALKTVAFHQAVNVTVGLPIVRTSVAHGTAYDIAWQGKASATNLVEAVRVAARLVEARAKRGQEPRASTAQKDANMMGS